MFDYLTQQLKLLPPLSLCFSLTLAAQRLWKDYEENIQRQEDGDLKGLPGGNREKTVISKYVFC